MESTKKKITFVNKFGDTICKEVETFNLIGTIMSRSIKKVGDNVEYRLWIEDGKGRYHITVWDYAKGFSSDKLKDGHRCGFKGIIQSDVICSFDGYTELKNYKAQEIF